MSSMTITPQFRAPTSTVRLTRRGRLVVFLVSLVLVLATAFILLGGASMATDKAGTPEPTTLVMVGDGDTLWDIASTVAADGETQAMVQRIESLNHLDSSMLMAGQQLLVPAE
ncbi:LysM peptidoglycan-binding domain-containing protein [Nocardioides sp.]|uniref:LysM peptidoglycan-binding domain-containing protein n=1 Tax=Nocardioides sp. TaxID=35761 RepID=UPI003D108505